jgi:flagellar assembly protein FliH
MKQFRPYHFPPLGQPRVVGALGDVLANATPNQEEWEGALADGFRQGQRDGYESGSEQGRAQGYAEGLQRGLDEGRAKALAQFDGLAPRLEAAIEAFKQLSTDYLATQRTEVVDLVGKIARQVIRAELALQPVQMLALVDEALSAMPPTRDEVEVMLNPEEMKRIQELDPKRAKKWNLLADPALEPGECRVRAGDHEVDAGCQGRLAACMEQVREGLAATDQEEAA